jgi:hypothetical protein
VFNRRRAALTEERWQIGEYEQKASMDMVALDLMSEVAGS